MIGLVGLIVVVGVVGFAVWRIYLARSDPKSSANDRSREADSKNWLVSDGAQDTHPLDSGHESVSEGTEASASSSGD